MRGGWLDLTERYSSVFTALGLPLHLLKIRIGRDRSMSFKRG